jgi:hypothetical protein
VLLTVLTVYVAEIRYARGGWVGMHSMENRLLRHYYSPRVCGECGGDAVFVELILRPERGVCVCVWGGMRGEGKGREGRVGAK